MAENFKDVVKKLGSTVKKPSAAKAPAVLAVQMVDSKGKVIKEEKGAAAAEAQREEEKRGKKTNTLLETIANAVTASAGTGVSEKDKQKGGLLAGIGGALSGMGIGVGAATAGIGALFAGGGYLLKQIAEFDGKAVVANVKELLNITEMFEGIGDAFSKSGIFAGVMTAIAAGLIAFSVGAGFAAALNYFTKGTKWAENTYDNVAKIISIKDISGYDDFDATKFSTTMGGISAGLIKFAIAEVMSGTAAKFTAEWKGPQAIYDNVKILISIKDIKGYDSFDATKFSTTMGGISAGLIKFAIAEVMSGIAAKFTEGVAWTQTIYDNVKKLISIKDIKGYDSFDADKFSATMGGISMGISKFAIAKIVEGVSSKFTTGVAWSQTVYDNIVKLISIKDIDGYDSFNATKFSATMGGISMGISKFAIAKIVEGVSSKFTTGVEWSQTIVDNVKTLLLIPALPGVEEDATKFEKVMGGIGAGLLAFSFGKAVAGYAEAITRFSGVGTEGSFATKIKDEVTTLLSILSDENATIEKSNTFKTVMGNISDGLLTFSGNTFLSSLLEVGKSVLGFLTGDSSPITEVMKLAEKSDELTKGADAISKIGDGLDKMGKLKFDGSDINLAAFAEDLMKSVPLIEKAIMGGTVEASFLENLLPNWAGGGSDLKFKGLASGDINYEEAAKNIRMLRKALGAEVNTPVKMPEAERLAKIAGSIPGYAHGGPIAAGRTMLVGEMGPEIILPNQGGQILNAQRTQQMLQAGIQRGMGGGGGGGITSINTGGNVVSAPTTNYVNNGIAARRPIILAA